MPQTSFKFQQFFSHICLLWKNTTPFLTYCISSTSWRETHRGRRTLSCLAQLWQWALIRINWMLDFQKYLRSTALF